MDKTYFSDVNDTKDTWSVVAKVLRKWVVKKKAAPYAVWKIGMLLAVKKIGVPIMLLRNIDQAAGLSNGTRLQIKQLGKNVIMAKALNGTSIGEDILIHRMDMNLSEAKLSFTMTRRQFPIIISFAITINKSQGQSMANVGLYLPSPVFSHGQLYVALSRVKSSKGLKILILNEFNKCTCTTTNVVYREVFQNLLLKP
ncbi:hypothetical protein K1719_000212 [Acacia pycnantha]|nr:hypothetical protein K1719_000212 [Acacia pycnantha]